jgi:hypothetical protein
MRSDMERDTIFAPIFDGTVLTDAVKATLKKWMPTYLGEIEFQRHLAKGSIPTPKWYTERNEFTTFAEDQIPLVVVISPGVIEPPTHNGEGMYTGWWGLGVGVVAAANTETNSDRLAKIYGAAVRSILLQKPGLDASWDFNGIVYVDESYDDVPDPEQERTMRAARLVFRIAINNVVTKWAGPDEPDPEDLPGSQWPTVETAEATVTREEEE